MAHESVEKTMNGLTHAAKTLAEIFAKVRAKTRLLSPSVCPIVASVAKWPKPCCERFLRQAAQVWNSDLAVPVVSRLGSHANTGLPIAANMCWRAKANPCGGDVSGTAPAWSASLTALPAFARIQRFLGLQQQPLMLERKLRKKAVTPASVRVQILSSKHVKRDGGFRRFSNGRAPGRTHPGQGLASAQPVCLPVRQKLFAGCQSGCRRSTRWTIST